MNVIERAEKAREVLDNPMVAEALEAMRAAYIAVLESLPVSDDLGRYRCTEALKQVRFIKAHLETAILQGELAAEDAKLEEAPKRGFRLF